jgi:hypothetical protein
VNPNEMPRLQFTSNRPRFGQSLNKTIMPTSQFLFEGPSAKFRGLRPCIEYALKNKWFRDDGVRQYLRLAKIRDDSSYLFMDEDTPRPVVKQRALIPAILGLLSSLAPTIGPSRSFRPSMNRD